MIVTWYPNQTGNGCGHFCARLGPGHTLSGSQSLENVQARYPDACIIDISPVSWVALADAPDNVSADYYVQHGGVVIQGGKEVRCG